jgi:hypothetical protein
VSALERLAMLFEIFTDSSSSCGAWNAKGCVCTWLLAGEERCYDCKTNGNGQSGRSPSIPHCAISG